MLIFVYRADSYGACVACIEVRLEYVVLPVDVHVLLVALHNRSHRLYMLRHINLLHSASPRACAVGVDHLLA